MIINGLLQKSRNLLTRKITRKIELADDLYKSWKQKIFLFVETNATNAMHIAMILYMGLVKSGKVLKLRH